MVGRVGIYLKNAVILTITGLALRAAGMCFRVYIAGRIGAEGMGLYQLIYTVYSLFITAATSGISMAATRLAAEELAQDGQGHTRGVMGQVLRLGGGIGLACGLVQLAIAYPAAKYLLGDVRTVLSLQILAVSLPFMAVSSAARGYFFARRRVGPNTRSQLYEQVVRIGLVMVLLPKVQEWGVGYACAAVVAGSTVSEILSGLLMLFYYKQDERRQLAEQDPKPPKGTGQRIRKILLPVEGGKCLDSALHTVENTLVPACLLAFLGSREQSLAQFGALKGMAMPILLFPFSFLTPLATLLLPEVTQAHILGRKAALERLVGRIMLLTNLFSVLAGGLIALYAGPLARLLYKDESIGLYLAVLAPVLPAMYLDAMGDSILKGLGEDVATFRYSIWDSALRIGLVLLLMPRFGMKGFLVVMLCSNLTAALLNILRIQKVAGIQTQWYQWFIQPILVFGICAALGRLVQSMLSLEGDLLRVVVGMLLIGGSYLLAMTAFGLGELTKSLWNSVFKHG